MANKLDPDKIKALLAKPPPRRGGGQVKDSTEPRIYDTWWKLHQRFGDCSNPDCKDDRPHRIEEGNTMVATVKEHDMCRVCFLDGWLSVSTTTVSTAA